MATRGTKVERHSVSEQPHELKYEAKETGTAPKRFQLLAHLNYHLGQVNYLRRALSSNPEDGAKR